MIRHYDVVIAGGGVIGASCAYQLSKRKHLKVALIDAKRPGNATRASAGGLWAIGESVGLGCGVIFFSHDVGQPQAAYPRRRRGGGCQHAAYPA